MNPQPKFNYFRSPKHLQAVRSLPCSVCGSYPSQAAHSNSGKHGKGKGIKSSDIYVINLCMIHHAQFDQSKMSRKDNEKWFMDRLKETVASLDVLGKLSDEARDLLIDGGVL